MSEDNKQHHFTAFNFAIHIAPKITNVEELEAIDSKIVQTSERIGKEGRGQERYFKELEFLTQEDQSHIKTLEDKAIKNDLKVAAMQLWEQARYNVWQQSTLADKGELKDFFSRNRTQAELRRMQQLLGKEWSEDSDTLSREFTTQKDLDLAKTLIRILVDHYAAESPAPEDYMDVDASENGKRLFVKLDVAKKILNREVGACRNSNPWYGSL